MAATMSYDLSYNQKEAGSLLFSIWMFIRNELLHITIAHEFIGEPLKRDVFKLEKLQWCMKNRICSRVICGRIENIRSLLPPRSLTLTILVPPYVHIKNYYSEIKNREADPKKWEEETESGRYVTAVENSIKQISPATVPRGICCVVLTDDLDPESDEVLLIGSMSLAKIMDSEDIMNDWYLERKIIWVYESRESVQAVEPTEGSGMISLATTPFSTICVLVRKGYGTDSRMVSKRLQNARLSEEKRAEISDNVWFVPHEAGGRNKDHLPKEVILRLIMTYSDEDDLVLDPFAGCGVTAVASKLLNRRYICLVDEEEKIQEIGERLKRCT